jgi:hypothetical protein
MASCLENDYFVPAKSYSGIVIDGNTRKPLSNTQVGLTAYEWEWEYLIIPDLDEYTIDATYTDSEGRFVLEDSELKATSIWFNHNSYARANFNLNNNMKKNFIVELYPKAILSLGITGSFSFIDQVTFSVESTKKVIYGNYPEKTTQKYTFGTWETRTGPFVWIRDDFLTGNYKLSVQFNNFKSDTDISFDNNDTLFYKIEFTDKIIITAVNPSKILPVIITLPVNIITFNSAYCYWQIQDKENLIFYRTGVVWSENPGPTTGSNNGIKTGETSEDKYMGFIYPLLSSKTYYARPFVNAFYKVFYGNEVLSQLCPLHNP